MSEQQDYDDPLRGQAEQTIDEMKVQTMYKMVQDTNINVNGKTITKKVLYLTNKQVALFDEKAMKRCIRSLDIGDPKFVIKLCPSIGVPSQMKLSHEEMIGKKEMEYYPSNFQSSEISDVDERIIESQILLFMKSCILPLAQQTRAVILVGGANDCYLSAALSNAALSEQARLGKDCPFTVIAMASEYEIHSRASREIDSRSIAAQIAKGCFAWKSRFQFLTDTFNKLHMEETLQRSDLTPAASRYIIFESIDEDNTINQIKLNNGPKHNFESMFLSCLVKELPSIAIQSHQIALGLSHLADLAARNIPILLLDTNERLFTMNKLLDPSKGPKTQFGKLTNSFPKISLEQKQRIQCDDKGKLSSEAKQELLTIAMKMMEESMTVLCQHHVVDYKSSSLVAFFHSVLHLHDEIASNHMSTLAHITPLYQQIIELDQLQKANRESKVSYHHDDLICQAIDFIQTKYTSYNILSMVAKVEYWLQTHLESHEMWSEANQYYQSILIQRKNILSNTYKIDINTSEWLHYYDIFTSDNVFSGSIHDIEYLKEILGSVAKIDRLPEENSLEALKTLQDAWDHYEMYNMIADSNKIMAKISYFALLIFGILIVTFTVLDAQFTWFNSRYPIIAISFLESAIASYVSFVNPALRWQQLRFAAANIESNIWMFRTRAGIYRVENETYEDRAQDILAFAIKQIKASVVDGADIKTTSFYGQMLTHNDHGQHKPDDSLYASFQSKLWHRFQCCYIICFSFWKKLTVTNPLKTLPVDTNELIDKYQIYSQQKNNNNNNKENQYISSNIFTSNIQNTINKYAKYQEVSIKPSNQDLLHELEANNNPTINNLETNSQNKEYLSQSDEDSINTNHNHHHVQSKQITESSKNISLQDHLLALRGIEYNINAPLQDSHYDLVQPDLYIQFRVIPALHFYQKRIPKCNRIRNVSQLFLVLGSIGTGLLSIVSLSFWSAVVSAFSAAIIAFIEFQGVNSKLNRYSFTVHALQELIVWWETLPQIERSVVSNIDQLVLTCEGLLQREQQAWRSTNEAIKLLQKKLSTEGHVD